MTTKPLTRAEVVRRVKSLGITHKIYNHCPGKHYPLVDTWGDVNFTIDNVAICVLCREKRRRTTDVRVTGCPGTTLSETLKVARQIHALFQLPVRFCTIGHKTSGGLLNNTITDFQLQPIKRKYN